MDRAYSPGTGDNQRRIGRICSLNNQVCNRKHLLPGTQLVSNLIKVDSTADSNEIFEISLAKELKMLAAGTRTMLWKDSR